LTGFTGSTGFAIHIKNQRANIKNAEALNGQISQPPAAASE
jgi:hypothetical protein